LGLEVEEDIFGVCEELEVIREASLPEQQFEASYTWAFAAGGR
jgi:hypothetical protein